MSCVYADADVIVSMSAVRLLMCIFLLLHDFSSTCMYCHCDQCEFALSTMHCLCGHSTPNAFDLRNSIQPDY